MRTGHHDLLIGVDPHVVTHLRPGQRQHRCTEYFSARRVTPRTPHRPYSVVAPRHGRAVERSGRVCGSAGSGHRLLGRRRQPPLGDPWNPTWCELLLIGALPGGRETGGDAAGAVEALGYGLPALHPSGLESEPSDHSASPARHQDQALVLEDGDGAVRCPDRHRPDLFAQRRCDGLVGAAGRGGAGAGFGTIAAIVLAVRRSASSTQAA